MTKIEVLLLGLIKEKSLNPYQITKILNIINISHWYPIGNSTVYVAIKKLHKKIMIVGLVEKEGNMPSKTVYSITEKGEKELLKQLSKFLDSTDIEIIKFSIACIFLCRLKKNTVLQILNAKELKLNNIISHLKDAINC